MIKETNTSEICTLTAGLSIRDSRKSQAKQLCIAAKHQVFSVKLFNRRASDWLPALVSVVLAAFLMIMVSLMMLNITGSVDARDFAAPTSKLNFDLMSARILNSPDCLAWEEVYVDLDSHEKIQTHMGIINYDKLTGANLDNCLGDKDYQISLKDLDGDVWTTSTPKSRGTASGIEDMFFVNIRKIGESEMHRGVLTIKL